MEIIQGHRFDIIYLVKNNDRDLNKLANQKTIKSI
jgi:hypothetical protein